MDIASNKKLSETDVDNRSGNPGKKVGMLRDLRNVILPALSQTPCYSRWKGVRDGKLDQECSTVCGRSENGFELRDKPVRRGDAHLGI